MEANIDNFINYTDSPSLFLAENFPDLNFDFRSPETEISINNNPPATTPSHSSAPSNHLSNGNSMRGPASHTGSDHRSPDTMTSSPDDDESRYNQTTASVSTNSKKIQKRNKEEKKVKAKHELEQLLATTAKKYIPEGIDDPNLDDKTKRKMVQMVKNRVAAQKTRDKRKNYMSELEEVKARLDEANRQLNERNSLLEQRVRELESSQARLMAENLELKRGGHSNTSQSRSMPQQMPQQQIQYPSNMQHNHPNMQQPQPHMQPMINSPHYPSLPSTPQNLMQPRFQTMTSMSSFDGFSFPQSHTRLNPNNNNYNNNSHTTITIENNDNSQNSSGGSNQQQQFNTPFPVLSRGNSGKRNFYGYLLAITMVLACFTTLHIETGKIVTPRHDGPVDHPPTPAQPEFGPPETGPDTGTGGGSGGGKEETTTETGTGTEVETDDGPGEPQPETSTGTEEGTGEPETLTGPETDADPDVVTNDVSSHNGTGDPTSNTFSTTSEGTDDFTGKDFGPSRFKTLDKTNNNTNNTNTTSITIDGSSSSGNPNVGRILVLTEILDEIDAMERGDY